MRAGDRADGIDDDQIGAVAVEHRGKLRGAGDRGIDRVDVQRRLGLAQPRRRPTDRTRADVSAARERLPAKVSGADRAGVDDREPVDAKPAELSSGGHVHAAETEQQHVGRPQTLQHVLATECERRVRLEERQVVGVPVAGVGTDSSGAFVVDEQAVPIENVDDPVHGGHRHSDHLGQLRRRTAALTQQVQEQLHHPVGIVETQLLLSIPDEPQLGTAALPEHVLQPRPHDASLTMTPDDHA